MKRMIDFLIRLYPKLWRDRYGTEFEAFLEDVRPGWPQVANVIWGAFKMQLSQGTTAKIVATFAGAGLLIAAVSGLFIHGSYVSTAVVRTPDDIEKLALAEQTVLSRTSLSAFLQKNGLYVSERKRQPLEDIIETMRTRDIHIEAGPNRMIRISFAADDPEKAQFIADWLTQKLNREIQGQGGEGFQIVDRPGLPKASTSPNRWLTALGGLLTGAIAGLLFAALRKLRRQTLRFAAVFGAAGLCLSLLGSYRFIPNRYISKSVIRIQPPAEAERVAGVLRDAIGQGKIKGAGVRVAGPYAVVVSATSEVQSTAQKINSDLVARALRFDPSNRVAVLDPATYPTLPAFPNRYMISFLGLTTGMLLGAATARFRSSATR